MPPSYFIGVDLGGTNIRAARFTRQSHIPESKTKRPTQGAGGPEAVYDRLEAAIREVSPADMSQVAGIGIAIPGPTDPHQGLVMKAPNIPGGVNIPLKKIMEDDPIKEEDYAKARSLPPTDPERQAINTRINRQSQQPGSILYM